MNKKSRGGGWPVRRAHTVVSAFTLAFAASFPTGVLPYAVGEAELRSTYSQPLRVRVPLLLNSPEEAHEASDISARLLPLSSYSELGLVPPPLAPESVTIDISGSGLAYAIDLRSSELIREPFITLMLEVRVRGVRILRELPLIFDLPAQVAAAPSPRLSAPVSQRVPAVALSTEIATEPTVPSPRLPESIERSVAKDTAHSAAKKPVPRQRSGKSESRRSGSKVTKSKRAPMFQLADWNPSYKAPTPLPRFQLAMRLESYEKLVAAGTAPQPASSALPAASAADAPLASSVLASSSDTVPRAVASATVVPRPASPANADAPVASEEAQGSWLAWLTVLLGALSAGAFAYWRSRAPQSAPVPAAPVQRRPLPAARRDTVPAAVPRVLRDADLSGERPPASVNEAPVAAAPADEAGAIRSRVMEIMNRTMDTNHRRKLQLVEAYIDLGRIESAKTLLGELETELTPKPSARMPITLIKG